MKKIIGLIAIYIVGGMLTLMLSNRVERLENREDLRNQNMSIAYNLK